MQQSSHRPRSQGFASHNKRAGVGRTAGTVPPAWRTTVAQVRPAYYYDNRRKGGSGDNAVEFFGEQGQPHERRAESRPPVGSRILMSQLPLETVHERDIEELFAETIGPVFDVFIIYNSSGRSKGMAVVTFQRSGDAAEARRKYNGKIIDGRRPLKIELIIDPPETPVAKVKSLVERVGGPAVIPNGSTARNVKPPVSTSKVANARPQIQRRKFKKGPRRLKKSIEQLDREMEAYMAAVPRFSENDVRMAMDDGGIGLV